MKKFVMMLALLMVTGVAYATAIDPAVCAVLRAQGDPCTESEFLNGTTQLPGVLNQLPGVLNQLPGGLDQLLPWGQNGNGWKLNVCINGINLLGESCQGDTWGNWNQPRQFKATGRDAVEVIRNSKIITSGFDNQGWALFVVTYNGKYIPAKGKTFSCRVSPDARQFLCISWVPGRDNRRNN